MFNIVKYNSSDNEGLMFLLFYLHMLAAKHVLGNNAAQIQTFRLKSRLLEKSEIMVYPRHNEPRITCIRNIIWLNIIRGMTRTPTLGNIRAQLWVSMCSSRSLRHI